MYGLLTKREVKIAGYWPSSFFACLWSETKFIILDLALSGVKEVICFSLLLVCCPLDL